MSGKNRLNASQYMKKLTGDALVQKFPQAFVEDPNLTPEAFFDILRSVKFDIHEAQLKVIELVRKPGEFIVPAALLDMLPPSPPESSPGTPTIQDESSFTSLRSSSAVALRNIEVDVSPRASKSLCQSRKDGNETNQASVSFDDSDEEIVHRKSALSSDRATSRFLPSRLKRRAPIVDSDDEILTFVRAEKKPRIPLLSKTSALSTVAESSKNATTCELFHDTDSEEEEDDDETPCYTNRCPSRSKSKSFEVNIQTSEISPRSKSKNNSVSQHPEVIEVSSEEDDEETEEEWRRIREVNTPCSSSRRDYSATPDFGDESEYEVPSENEELRDVSPEDWPTHHTAKVSSEKRIPGGNPNEAVLKHRNQSLATPWLHTLAHPYYPNKVGMLDDYPHERGPEAIPELQEYLENVKTIACEQEDQEYVRFNQWEKDNPGRQGYASVTIDGVEYHTGDCVMVRSHSLHQTKTRCKGNLVSTSNSFATDPWYSRIVHLYKDEFGDKKAHLRWFHHGSATALGELASTNELFLLSDCSDESVDCFASKIVVTFVKKALDDVGGVVEHNFVGTNEYFYRFQYNPDTKAFTDVSTNDRGDEDLHHGSQHCQTCNNKIPDHKEGYVKILGTPKPNGSQLKFEGFYRGGIDYHRYDFVYIFQEEKMLYQIGQITGISASSSSYSRKEAMIKEDKLHMKIDIYERFDKFQVPWFDEIMSGTTPQVRDERRLYHTSISSPTRRTPRIMLNQLDGKCYVRHRKDIENLDMYKNKDDHFWVENRVSPNVEGRIRRSDLVPFDSTELQYSDQSTAQAEQQELRYTDFSQQGKRLVAMDLFSGAGGLTLGMELSGVVETRHAVEFSEAAARTYKKNFPKCQMHNADISLMLERAIKRDQGEHLEPLYDCHGDLVGDLPVRGSIGFIYGGCPCPGYSSLNRFKKGEDVKNSLLVVLLSYVDYYRPKYFLLENVRGLLSHRLGATQASKGKVEGGIENGTVKFVLRAVTSLGYQVHFGLLQAAQYGVASSRDRVFFWASLPGYALPKLPQKQNLYHSPCGNKEATWYHTRRSAPHRACTVGDTITDLPRFDWSHPWRGEDDATMKTREFRWNHGINQYEVHQGEDAVGLACQQYATSPLSEYQRKLRIGGPDKLFNHVTQHWSEDSTVLVCEIPMVPGADHRDVSTQLRPKFLWHPDFAAARNNFYPGRFGRLNMESSFRVCLTSMNPGQKNGQVLHPTQHRVLSIVEYARAMSFPDSFLFDLDGSRVLDIIRQIGNAVPPFLAKAVGSGLAESVVLKFEDDRKAKPEKDQLRQAIKTEYSIVPECSAAKKHTTEGHGVSHDVIYIDSDDE